MSVVRLYDRWAPRYDRDRPLWARRVGGHLVVLFWSRPRFPWGLPMWFAERVFQMRSLRPEEVEGFPGQIVCRQFASEAITLMAWHKR